MNVECTDAALAEMEGAFRFNDAVIRKLVCRRDDAVAAQSPLFKNPEDEKKEYRSRGDSDAANEPAGEDADDAEAADASTEAGA
jgi:small subunit ribosomal protein S6